MASVSCPPRPYKPRDKAKAENGVLVVERWIVAALRHRSFFSLPDLNQAIRELLEKLNQRPFRKRPGCRASLFQELDRPALGPLPAERYELHHWTKRVSTLTTTSSLTTTSTAFPTRSPARSSRSAHADDGGDLPPRPARRFARPQLSAL